MKTQPHYLSRKNFYKLLLMKEGIFPVSICGMLVVIGIFLSIFFGIEFFIVALMFVFIVFPFIMAMLYFVHALKPITLLNTSLHTLSLQKEGLEINLEENERKIEIPYSEIDKYYAAGKGIVVMIKERKKGWLYIPADAFEDNESFQLFISGLYQADKSDSEILIAEN